METNKRTSVLLLDRTGGDRSGHGDLLATEQMQVYSVSSIRTASSHLATGSYDAVVVHERAVGDRLMGFCRQARLRDPRLVIVSSLARQRDWLEQELFGCGVNDVVSDEFSASVVATRILVRLAERDKMGFGRHGVELGDTIINVVRREIIRGDRRISLTRRQAQLLAYLMNNSERIVSRTELVENIWENTIDPNGKNLDMYVAQLRKAIEPDPTNPIHLLTVWNTGYRFAISGPTGDGALQAANQATSQDGESSE